MLLTEITAHNRQFESRELPDMHLLVLRDMTLDPIEHFLKYHAFRMGHRAYITWGSYNTIFQDSFSASSDHDFILIFPKLELTTERLTDNFALMGADDIQAEESSIVERFRSIFSNIRQRTRSAVLCHSFELPLYPKLGIFDPASKFGQLDIIRRINSRIRQIADEFGGIYCVDTDLCVRRLGSSFYDMRMWHVSRLPYSLDGLREIASEDFKYIRALKGKNKKCLVLDCDNTLWGGIVGEDGADRIVLDWRFANFQREVVNLFHRGIIIALLSKNNETDVWEVFEARSDMVLGKEHLAAYRINWNDKASNIRQIAEDLNIGLDSIVLADDSEFECSLVKSLIPEIETLHLTKPVEYGTMLASCGLFDTHSLSKEDRKRGQMYREDARRKIARSDTMSLLDYYSSLEMELEIGPVTGAEVSRASQLTQRTNQFNFTTKRYSEEEIKQLMESTSHDAYFIRAGDNIGDLGIVGLIILKYDRDTAVIDTFLMSCRALGRTIEDVFLTGILEIVRRKGFQRVIGSFIATRKNMQVRDYFEKFGFAGSNGNWTLSTDRIPKNDFSHFKKILIRDRDGKTSY